MNIKKILGLLIIAMVSATTFHVLFASAHTQRQLHVIHHTSNAGPGPVSWLHYEVPATLATVSQTRALQVAQQRVGEGLAGQATQIDAHYVLFSDENNYSIDAQGQKHYAFARLPAWVVTFSGVNFALRGRQPAYNHEVNVVIDARTGQDVMLFSYR